MPYSGEDGCNLLEAERLTIRFIPLPSRSFLIEGCCLSRLHFKINESLCSLYLCLCKMDEQVMIKFGSEVIAHPFLLITVDMCLIAWESTGFFERRPGSGNSLQLPFHYQNHIGHLWKFGSLPQ